ncbi:50S ribosomal protein L11 methyltransferase [Pelistega suis]|uniref:Ribosomal protein L11 methyltransferase n=1 Tax=Pelistega suis TaxID=1631957 RepID=A0A849P1H0_9BURK|nr:50S ribosomal protein L11 methyltransferase [Pelistega suis]MCQ9328070.1 50S ribosomal protein L11 methyltransferase [Pelistega suis]NOL50856.1 50S ribosomal protein L11 methyltransferase [Pelistega suis]
MRELVLLSLESEAEALSDLLLECGALSVSVEDADFNTDSEKPLFGEPGTEPEVQAWVRNYVIALLPDDVSAEQMLVALTELSGKDFSDVATVREVANEDWVRLTQSQFDPIQIADRIWIVPSWHKENPDVLKANEDNHNIFIELDPGLAFGTGSHPTTHLCAEWLARNVQAGLDILDYGHGSGILAIIAKKLGAKRVLGVDIDEQAVVTGHYNAQVNNVEIDFMLPDALADGQFDIVVANILSNPLKVLAPMLASRVKTGGHLVLSGVLERQAEEVAQAYAPYIQLSVWKAEEGWVCLHGVK